MKKLHRRELIDDAVADENPNNLEKYVKELNCEILWNAAEKEAEARNLVWIHAEAALKLAITKEAQTNFAAWASKENAAWRKSEWEKAKNA